MTFHYDVNFINPFLEGVINVLSTMADIEAKAGKPFINKKRTTLGDVSGLINISGSARGTMALSLETGTILKIVNNMLYENYTEIDEQILDAVGELTNMIAGQARGKLSEQGMSFQASTPEVVLGKDKKMKHLKKAPILAIPFETPDGNLIVEVCFAPNEEG